MCTNAIVRKIRRKLTKIRIAFDFYKKPQNNYSRLFAYVDRKEVGENEKEGV